MALQRPAHRLLRLMASLPSPPQPWCSPLPCRAFSSTTAAFSHIGSAPIALPPDVSLLLDPSSGYNRKTAAMRQTVSLIVKGPLGQLSVDLPPYLRLALPGLSAGPWSPRDIIAQVADSGHAADPTAPGAPLVELPKAKGHLVVAVEDAKVKQQKAMWGLVRALLNNAVIGVTQGFTAKLKMVGVGYRGSVEDKPNDDLLNPVPGLLGVPSGAEGVRDGSKAGPKKRLRLKLGFSNDVLLDLPNTSTFLEAKFLAPTELELRGVDKQEVSQFAASVRMYRKPEPYNGKGIFVNGETIRRKEVKKK